MWTNSWCLTSGYKWKKSWSPPTIQKQDRDNSGIFYVILAKNLSPSSNVWIRFFFHLKNIQFFRHPRIKIKEWFSLICQERLENFKIILFFHRVNSYKIQYNQNCGKIIYKIQEVDFIKIHSLIWKKKLHKQMFFFSISCIQVSKFHQI